MSKRRRDDSGCGGTSRHDGCGCGGEGGCADGSRGCGSDHAAGGSGFTAVDTEALKRLVSDIMREIGFGFEPDWYTGGSAAASRRAALERLPKVIAKHNNEWAPIAPAIPELIEVLAQAVTHEERNTPLILHRTWQTARIVILKHIELFHTLESPDDPWPNVERIERETVETAQEAADRIRDEPQTAEEKRTSQEGQTAFDFVRRK
ncbi:hypothetical protein AMJ57_04575 [Parcubacteria bacterium SG8_24]|nr:MAG: hypothetical protein AMJ57_04575 [Parcubacteria bacterium SG8_24]